MNVDMTFSVLSENFSTKINTIIAEVKEVDTNGKDK
jgi:hypothetical protein|nr:MAG TPA: hypothetical protein [Caudoviricetes sp.]